MTTEAEPSDPWRNVQQIAEWLYINFDASDMLWADAPSSLKFNYRQKALRLLAVLGDGK